MGTFFKAQPDTPAKLAGFADAFEARGPPNSSSGSRGGPATKTAAVAERILAEERTAAERVAAT